MREIKAICVVQIMMKNISSLYNFLLLFRDIINGLVRLYFTSVILLRSGIRTASSASASPACAGKKVYSVHFCR